MSSVIYCQSVPMTLYSIIQSFSFHCNPYSVIVENINASQYSSTMCRTTMSRAGLFCGAYLNKTDIISQDIGQVSIGILVFMIQRRVQKCHMKGGTNKKFKLGYMERTENRKRLILLIIKKKQGEGGRGDWAPWPSLNTLLLWFIVS